MTLCNDQIIDLKLFHERNGFICDFIEILKPEGI